MKGWIKWAVVVVLLLLVIKDPVQMGNAVKQTWDALGTFLTTIGL